MLYWQVRLQRRNYLEGWSGSNARGSRWQKTFGRRNVTGRGEATSEDTIYDTASLTKVLATAPSILILAERGKLKLNAPVVQYIPEFSGDKRQDVTIRQLLTHTSGLRPGISLRDNWIGREGALAKTYQEKLQQMPDRDLNTATSTLSCWEKLYAVYQTNRSTSLQQLKSSSL